MDFGKGWLAVHFALTVILAAGIMPGFAADRNAGGNPVPLDVAKRVAVNHLNAVSANNVFSKTGTVTEENVTEVFTGMKEGKTVYYVINLESEGWVIVSADYVAIPIIGYSDEGAYSEDNPPPAFVDWMENVKNEIYDAIVNKLIPLHSTNEDWKRLDVSPKTFLSKMSKGSIEYASGIIVSPLLSTIWGQGGKNYFCTDVLCYLSPLDCAWYVSEDRYCPYEKKYACPGGSAGGPYEYYRVAPTGCVATAMGQIMKKWNWPPSGEGSHTWDPPFAACCVNTYGPETVDFASRTYNWSIMPNDVWKNASGAQPERDKQVARLLRDIGVAVHMNYTPTEGSGASYWDWSGGNGCDETSASDHCALKAFHDYFRYHGIYTRRSCNTDDYWIDLLKDELDAGRPVLYRGDAGPNTDGHAFVCDGYDSDNKFHMNWGWDGSHNGDFTIDGLTPNGSDFNSGQAIIYDIYPDKDPIAICKPAIPPVTLSLDGNGQVVVDPSAVDNGSYDPDGSPVTLQVNPSQFNCTHIGLPQGVTLTVTDNTGNTDDCGTFVIVVDNKAPVVKTKNINAYLDANGQVSIAAVDVDNGSSDNCGIANRTVSPNSFTCANMGPNTVTLTVTDIYGHVSTGTATVTVVDNVPPTITCPADANANNDPGNCSAVVNGLSPTTDDNCGVVLQTWTMSGATTGSSPAAGINDVSGEAFGVGVTTVTYSIEDAAGNNATCTFTVTVTDNEDPIVTNPDMSVPNDLVGCGAVVDYDPVCSDNCPGVICECDPPSGSFFSLAESPHTVNCTATDAVANTSTHSFTVTVYPEDVCDGHDNDCDGLVDLSDPDFVGNPDFDLTASPDVATAQWFMGFLATATYDLTVTSLDCYSSAVSLSVTGLPPGTRRYYFDPDDEATPPSRDSETVMLVVEVTRSTMAGSYSLTITGDEGSITHDYNVTLEVTRPPRTGRFLPKIGVGVPEEYVLFQNYPNPFNPETSIDFGLPEDGDVKVTVYNMLGHEVEVLGDVELEAGYYSVPWNATGLPSGVYFYRIEANNFTATKSMLFMK